MVEFTELRSKIEFKKPPYGNLYILVDLEYTLVVLAGLSHGVYSIKKVQLLVLEPVSKKKYARLIGQA